MVIAAYATGALMGMPCGMLQERVCLGLLHCTKHRLFSERDEQLAVPWIFEN